MGSEEKKNHMPNLSFINLTKVRVTFVLRDQWVWRLYFNMAVHAVCALLYLKTEVAKYIYSLWRIFKIARQIQ